MAEKIPIGDTPRGDSRYRDLIDSLREGYFFYRHDTAGVFEHVSPSIKDVLGYTPEEFERHYTQYLTQNPINKNVEHRTEQSIRGVRQPPYEVEIYHKDGSIRVLDVTEVPVLDSGGHVIAVEGIAHDITEEKMLKRELTRAIELLDATGEMAKVGGWEFDVDTMQQRWTKEVYRIHEVGPDFKPDVTSGINFYDPDDRQMVQEAVRRAIEEGTPFDFEARLITAKGKRLWVRAIGKAYREGERTVRVGGTFQDITEARAAEDIVKKSAEEWQRTFDSISDIVFILDGDNTIRRANKTFTDLFGIKAEEVIGKKCYEIIHKSNSPWNLCPHVKTMRDGEAHTEEVDDPVLGIPLLISTSPIFDDDGVCIGSVHIAKDISEIRRIRKELEQKVSDLERFNAVTMGREKRILELKEEIRVLKEHLEKKNREI